MGSLVTEVLVWLPGLSLEMAVWLPVNLTHGRLGFWVVYCGEEGGFSGKIAADCGSLPRGQQRGSDFCGAFSSCLMSPASASEGINPTGSWRTRGTLTMSSLDGLRMDQEGPDGEQPTHNIMMVRYL